MEDLAYKFLILALSGIFLFAVWVHAKIVYRRYLHPLRKLPGKLGNFYLGTIVEFTKDNHPGDVELRWTKEFPDAPIIRFTFIFSENKVLVTDPELLKHILVTNSSNYNKDLYSYRMVKKYVLGNGLVCLDGEEHTRHRSIITEAFSYKYLKDFIELFSHQGKILTELWDKTPEGGLVNVQDDLLNLGLNAVGITSFGFDFETLNENPSPESLDLANKFVHLPETYRMGFLSFIFPLYNALPTPFNIRRAKAKAEINKGVERVVMRKIQKLEQMDGQSLNNRKMDLLEIIMNLKDANGNSLSTSDLIDEAKTFIFAGYETSASAMNWVLYLLASNPGHSDIIAKEVDEIMGDRELVEPDDVERFKYLNLVVKESLRLFPPVPVMVRHCVKDDWLGDTFIPAGTAVNFGPYAMHRNPKYWPNPDKFDPLRFTPENSKDRHPYTYIPFLHGPRNCIGQKFGMIEMKCVLAMILRKFDFTMPEGWVVTPKSFVSLRSYPKLKMHIHKRN